MWVPVLHQWPDQSAALADAIGDRGCLGRHLEALAEGLAEPLKHGGGQAANGGVQLADCGWIEGRQAGIGLRLGCCSGWSNLSSSSDGWLSFRCRLPLALLRGWSSVLSWSRRSGHHPQRCGPGRWLVGGTSASSRSSPGDFPLLLVVKRQTEGIAKGHQRPLHGIGFGFLEGRLMGLAQVGVDAVAGAAALADQLGPLLSPTVMRTRAV